MQGTDTVGISLRPGESRTRVTAQRRGVRAERPKTRPPEELWCVLLPGQQVPHRLRETGRAEPSQPTGTELPAVLAQPCCPALPCLPLVPQAQADLPWGSRGSLL